MVAVLGDVMTTGRMEEHWADCWRAHHECAIVFCDRLTRQYGRDHPIGQAAEAHRAARERWRRWLRSPGHHGHYGLVEDTMRVLTHTLKEYGHSDN
jgi:hypothetical protein